jgi:hypothetical protein
MKAGVQIELGGDTGAVKAFAQAAEDLGYDHIVIYDHVLGASSGITLVTSRPLGIVW